MIDLGIYSGLNLDGGGSTALVESENGAPTLIDSPSGTDGAVERYVGNNLGVYADPLPAPEPASVFALALGLLALVEGRFLYRTFKAKSPNR